MRRRIRRSSWPRLASSSTFLSSLDSVFSNCRAASPWNVPRRSTTRRTRRPSSERGASGIGASDDRRALHSAASHPCRAHAEARRRVPERRRVPRPFSNHRAGVEADDGAVATLLLARAAARGRGGTAHAGECGAHIVRTAAVSLASRRDELVGGTARLPNTGQATGHGKRP